MILTIALGYYLYCTMKTYMERSYTACLFPLPPSKASMIGQKEMIPSESSLVKQLVELGLHAKAYAI